MAALADTAANGTIPEFAFTMLFRHSRALHHQLAPFKGIMTWLNYQSQFIIATENRGFDIVGHTQKIGIYMLIVPYNFSLKALLQISTVGMDC